MKTSHKTVCTPITEIYDRIGERVAPIVTLPSVIANGREAGGDVRTKTSFRPHANLLRSPLRRTNLIALGHIARWTKRTPRRSDFSIQMDARVYQATVDLLLLSAKQSGQDLGADSTCQEPPQRRQRKPLRLSHPFTCHLDSDIQQWLC